MNSPRIRLLYIIAYPNRWPQAEGFCRLIDARRFEVSVILMHSTQSPLVPHLEQAHIPYKSLRMARHGDLARAVRFIFKYCQAKKIEIVHAHFMQACLAGLLAARLAGVRVRIHTRHHAGPLPWFHRKPWGELYDRWNNRNSSAIIAPCHQAREALVHRDGVPEQRVQLIHHGFDLTLFRQVSRQKREGIKVRFGLEESYPIIGVVSRFERIKGLDYLIPAFALLLTAFPRARLLLVNGKGKDSQRIHGLLAQLPPGSHLTIPFEEDIWSLLAIFDVFVHVPIHPRMEGFGQVYIEALAAGIPCVFTRAGIADEFANNPATALFVDFCNSEQIFEAMKTLLNKPALCRELSQNGQRYVASHFAIEPMVQRLEQLYLAEFARSVNGVS